MFCKECGAKLTDSTKFCPECGTTTHYDTSPEKATKPTSTTVLPETAGSHPAKIFGTAIAALGILTFAIVGIFMLNEGYAFGYNELEYYLGGVRETCRVLLICSIGLFVVGSALRIAFLKKTK